MVNDQQPSVQLRQTPPLAGLGFLALVAIALAGAILLAGAASAAPSALRHGDPAIVANPIPTLTGPFASIPIDLDGDGTRETIALSGEGVLQRYDADGRYAWGLDTQEVLTAAGLFGETAGHIMGPYRGALGAAPAGPVFADLDGDGVKDVVALMLVAEDAPANRYHTALLRIDGASGQIENVTLYDGVIRTLQTGDFDGDGDNDLFLLEENGAPTTLGAYTIGTGAPTRMWVEDAATATPLWNASLPGSWPQVTAAATADLTGTNPDLLLAITEPLGRFVADLDTNSTPFAQDLLAIGGTTGIILFDVPLAQSQVREILLADVDADGTDDAVLRIQEPTSRSPSLGDARARLEARSGADGSHVWSRTDFGHLPILHDIATYSPTRVALAWTERSTATYPAEDIEHAALFDPTDGRTTGKVRLATSAGIGLDLIPSNLGIAPIARPTHASETPVITHMRLAVGDLDDDGAMDLITGSTRGMNGVKVGATTLATLWSNDHVSEPGTFVPIVRAASTEVWTQDRDTARLIAYRASDGGEARSTPLLGLMAGYAEADLDADGVIDRAVGGASRTVFAFKGTSEQLLWQRTLAAPVIDLATTDANKDTRLDLIVVTTTGSAILDGRDGRILWEHTHDHAQETGAWRFADLDQDGVLDLVTGTRSTSHLPPRIEARSGSTGASLWTNPLPAPAARVTSLAMGDLDRDGVQDVAYTTQSAAEGLFYGAGTIDGKTGILLWRSDMLAHGGRTTLEHDGVVMADVDGDRDLDVVVAVRGGALVAPSLRAHDGATGIVLWEKATGATILENVGLWKGFVGPSGSEALLVAGRTDGGTQLAYLTTKGGPIASIDYPGLTHLTDVQTAEIDGDGIDDVVLASPEGLVGIDSGPTVAGSTVHLGHLTQYAATKVRLVDPDGDGRHSVVFLSHERNHPIGHGAAPFMDANRGKAFGTAGLTDGTTPPPANQPPVVQILQEDPAIQGQAVTFRSTSYDPDGLIVNTTWTFPDGTERYGTTADYTWHLAGSYDVLLRVMDDEGAVADGRHRVEVRPIYGHASEPERVGGFGTPGKTYVFNFTITNSGVQNDTYTPALVAAPEGWNVTILNATTVTLPSGASHTYETHVSFDVPRPRGEVQIDVNSQTTGGVESFRHRILVPLIINATLFNGHGPYGPVDDVAGSVQVTWYDGTPVAGLVIALTSDGGGSEELTTSASGQAVFVAPKDLIVAHSPGQHVLSLDPMMEHYDRPTRLMYVVTLP